MSVTALQTHDLQNVIDVVDLDMSNCNNFIKIQNTVKLRYNVLLGS